jgi:hypothetical protein
MDLRPQMLKVHRAQYCIVDVGKIFAVMPANFHERHIAFQQIKNLHSIT